MSHLSNTAARVAFTVSRMSRAEIDQAVAPVGPTVVNIRPEQLGDPTPCTDFDVRRLINHLLFWLPSLEAAGRKQAVPPPASDESDIDLVCGNWAAELVDQLRQTAIAWGEPQAWEGMTQMGNTAEMPASVIGGMVLGEVVVHGWDLAVATGQQIAWDDEVLNHVLRDLQSNADLGRKMNLYGPEVPISDDATLLDRVVGLTGRTPR